MVNTAAAVAHNGVLRSKEDTIDYMSNPNFGEIYNATHRWQVVKRNSSREIQGQISDSDVDFKLMGYTIGSDPVFFPNDPTDITPIAANAWTTVDISSLVSVDDDGVILFVYSEADNEKIPDSDPRIRRIGKRQNQYLWQLALRCWPQLR